LLARLLFESNQLDAAEEAISRALDLSSGKGNQFQVSECHHLLGLIYQSKGESEAAINRLETALGIASNSNSRNLQFWSHYSLARLFSNQGRFDDAYTHIEHSKSYAVNDTHKLGLAMELHAEILYWHDRFGEARSEVLCAAETFEKLGSARELKWCRDLLRLIEEEMNDPVANRESDSDGESLGKALFLHLFTLHS